MKQEIITADAPLPIGPYSQAILFQNLIFFSGQIPINPADNQIIDGGIEEQTKQVMQNIKSVLEKSGSNFQNVIKTTIFLKDINDFPKVNNIYKEYFSKPYPARSTVEVSRLPKDVLLEIEVVAYKK